MAKTKTNLKTKLPYIIKHLDDASMGAAKAGAERIAETARILAPVRTGKLKESIEARPEDERFGGNGFEVVAKAFYANWVENGTRHSAAQPFLMPAFELHRKDIVTGMGLAIREVIYSNAGYGIGMVPLRGKAGEL